MKNKLKVATVLLILIVSGCSNYSNLQRQRSFFNTKSHEQPTKFSFKSNKNEKVEVQDDSAILEELTKNSSREDRIDEDSQQNKSKDKFVFNYPKRTFIKESIPLVKGSLPKIFKFHETKNLNALKNKLTKRNTFPLVLIMLGVAIGLIGLIFGIGYLSEKINYSRPEVIPEKRIKQGRRNGFANSSLIVVLLSLIVLTISVLLFMFADYAGLIITAFIGLFIALILALIAAILGIIAQYQENHKDRKVHRN